MLETKSTVRPGERRVEDGPSSTSEPTVIARQQAESVSSLGIDLRIVSDLAEIEQQWKTFERRADCTVFQSFDWLAKWQSHIGLRAGTVPAVVLGRDADGDVLFILPLAIETRGRVRRLTWLGSELCDYNMPLLAKHCGRYFSSGRFVALWREIEKLLQTEAHTRFDLVDFQKMPEAIGGQRNPFLDLGVLPHPSGAHIAHLDSDWDRFYAAKRSPSTRKRERRQFKQLAEHGEIRFVDVQDREEIGRTLDTLFSQKTRSFARMGVEDMFARPGYQEFFRDIALDPRMSEVIHITRLDVGTTVAAASLGFRFRDCYYLVISSYQDGELSRFGPGRAHLQALLRHAIDRGFQRFDFTVGDESYKRDWSDTELIIFDHLAAITIRGWLVVAMTAAFRRTKRRIKQSPIMWRAFSKIRVLVGSITSR